MYNLGVDKEKVLPQVDGVNDFRSIGCSYTFYCPEKDEENCPKDGNLHLCRDCPVAAEMAGIFFAWLKKRRNFSRIEVVEGNVKDNFMMLANNDAFEVIDGHVYESTSTA